MEEVLDGGSRLGGNGLGSWVSRAARRKEGGAEEKNRGIVKIVVDTVNSLCHDRFMKNTLSTEMILKSISDAISILFQARLNREIAKIPACYTRIINAENHLSRELAELTSDPEKIAI